MCGVAYVYIGDVSSHCGDTRVDLALRRDNISTPHRTCARIDEACVLRQFIYTYTEFPQSDTLHANYEGDPVARRDVNVRTPSDPYPE
jgi:hypothetical protein